MNTNACTTSPASTDIIIENVFSYDNVLQLSKLCDYEPFCDEPEADDLIQLAAFTKDTHCLVGFISCLNTIIDSNADSSNDIDSHNDTINNDTINLGTSNLDTNNLDTIKSDTLDDIVIEFTAMVAPDYRRQHIFTAMFDALICAVNSLISDNSTTHRNIKYITAIDDETANSIISHQHNLMGNTAGNTNININIEYTYSEYLMELSVEHILHSQHNQYTEHNGYFKLNGYNNHKYNTYINNSSVLPDTIELLKYDDEYQLVSNTSDELISSISFEHFNTHICIHDVWTDPDMRRCGYARLLLAELIQDWKNDSLNNNGDDNIIPLILHVSGSNMPAVRLYKSSGFVVREEVKYYSVKYIKQFQ